MIPDTLTKNGFSLRIMDTSLIGIPSPHALRSDKFPGVMLGSDPAIGHHCIIFGNVFIGNGFRCGNNVLIRDFTAIGDRVSIGSRSYIDTGVTIADGVTIGEDVLVAPSTKIGSSVAIGSRVRLLGDTFTPDQTGKRTRGVILGDGCIIGDDAVIRPGVCVGAGAVVKPFTTVTKDLPPVVRPLDIY